jgi:hypothetical protein
VFGRAALQYHFDHWKLVVQWSLYSPLDAEFVFYASEQFEKAGSDQIFLTDN